MMRILIVTVLAFAPSLTYGSEATTLRDAAAKRGIYVGAAVNAGHLGGDSAYKALAQNQYNLVTAENACKWGPIEHQQGKFNFTQCDELRDFALQTMKGVFRGHNLCWGHYNPSWLSSLSASGKKAALIHHIQEVAKHYGSDAFAWDVVNEAITDDAKASDPLKRSDWYPDVPDFVDVAFTTARAAFPKGVKLFYNDYNIASSSGRSKTKSDRVYNMVKSMIARKVPIDGVGLQFHIKAGYEIAGVKANMERFGALGLDVHITELDISYSSWDKTAEQEQAKLYADLLQVCLEVPACKNFETWGFTDKYTWMGTEKHPLPFDENLKPKLTVAAMVAVLTGSPAPGPSPPGPTRGYDHLTQVCQNAAAVSGKISVGSVAECEKLCDAHSGCTSLDTNGAVCYLKSHCEGQVGQCSGWCGYRVKTSREPSVIV